MFTHEPLNAFALDPDSGAEAKFGMHARGGVGPSAADRRGARRDCPLHLRLSLGPTESGQVNEQQVGNMLLG